MRRQGHSQPWQALLLNSPSMAALVLAVALLAGCAGPQPTPPLAAKTAPVVYVYPLEPLAAPASVTVLPFQTPAGSRPDLGAAAAQLFKDVLMGKRAFRTVVYRQEPWHALTDAVAAGRRAGTRYVLAGRITRLLPGVELGGGEAEIHLRLLETAKGRTVWYVAENMLQPPAYPEGGFLPEIRRAFSFSYPSRAPQERPVTTAMLLRLAEDLTDVMAGARTVSH